MSQNTLSFTTQCGEYPRGTSSSCWGTAFQKLGAGHLAHLTIAIFAVAGWEELTVGTVCYKSHFSGSDTRGNAATAARECVILKLCAKDPQTPPVNSEGQLPKESEKGAICQAALKHHTSLC